MNKQFLVLGFGEILWDILPNGKQLGGAPANFAFHCNQQGMNGIPVSAVGKDELGDEILKLLKAKNIDRKAIRVLEDKATSTVDVVVDKAGKPTYQIHENVAWDYLQPNSDLETFFSTADAICFGTLAQRSDITQQTLFQLFAKVKQEALVVFDINLRQQYYSLETIEKSLQFANVFKLNDEELIVLKDLLVLKGDTEEAQLKELLDTFNLKYIALTKGAEGSLIMSSSETTTLATPKVKVVDTVGAGDSFTATMVAGILKGEAQKVFHEKAVKISAMVCEHHGAMPDLRN
ncbi:carbohydrate kinase family protein [Sediminitomix flava]|uniref:Fructokinase n=1 Tax=Sediminitomix flava TaxID=379075 RepID=A0A315ZDP3_SEDFL|nr:carbohydrate kinase [Sediminitomix flava]PWJ43260.1 fructokinase [Sediminitomix flava]